MSVTLASSNRRGFLASSAAVGAPGLVLAAVRAVSRDNAIRPFRINVPDEALVDLRLQRLNEGRP